MEEALNLAHGLCVRFEGFFAEPYLCPGGYPTIGYGFRYYPDGRSVTLKDAPMSRDAAIVILRMQLKEKYLPAALKLCPGLKKESPGRLAAILDFTFNLGAGRMQTSTLRKRVNSGAWDEVPWELRKWTLANGQKLNGLVLRREAEISFV